MKEQRNHINLESWFDDISKNGLSNSKETFYGGIHEAQKDYKYIEKKDGVQTWTEIHHNNGGREVNSFWLK